MPKPPYLLITRPEADAVAMANRLSSRGVKPLICPLLTYHPIASGITALEQLYRQFLSPPTCLLTSKNAVRAIESIESLKHIPILTVGEETASYAKQASFTNVTVAGDDAKAFIHYLQTQPCGKTIIYPSATELSEPMAQFVASFSFDIKRICVYSMQPIDQLPSNVIAHLNQGNIDIITFFSKRTAETFCQLVDSQQLIGYLNRVHAICMSPAIAQSLVNLPFASLHTSQRPHMDSLLEVVYNLRPE